MSCRTAKPQLHTNADIALFEIGKCNKRKQPAAAAAAAEAASSSSSPSRVLSSEFKKVKKGARAR
jgi:hypothetical protein